MDRNRHNRNRHHGNNKNNKEHKENKEQNLLKKEPSKFRFIGYDNIEARVKREKAIEELKSRVLRCPKCGEIIDDVPSSICDKETGAPMHFECVMKQLSDTEKLGQNEKICYIGQGRFGILYFENPRDQRHFKIKKIIEWEERDKKIDWRDEVSGLYSQID